MRGRGSVSDPLPDERVQTDSEVSRVARGRCCVGPVLRGGAYGLLGNAPPEKAIGRGGRRIDALGARR